MDPFVAVAILMLWIVDVLLTYMTYLGYDVRSRGYECDGMVVSTLPKLGITIRDYYNKRGDHPVVDTGLASKARAFRILTFIGLVILVVSIVLLFIF